MPTPVIADRVSVSKYTEKWMLQNSLQFCTRICRWTQSYSKSRCSWRFKRRR
uniref:Uncharacterized protein n=1 Tax=Hyaloperonospora arabidopsidis (strain Emoy2) TaxID=559515 RepID=M4C461_HYAAE